MSAGYRLALTSFIMFYFVEQSVKLTNVLIAFIILPPADTLWSKAHKYVLHAAELYIEFQLDVEFPFPADFK